MADVITLTAVADNNENNLSNVTIQALGGNSDDSIALLNHDSNSGNGVEYTSGDGADIFIGGRYQGADNFYSASSADIVNLNDATLSDIVAAVEVNGNIALGFNTGNIITIQSTDTLSAAISLADGSA